MPTGRYSMVAVHGDRTPACALLALALSLAALHTARGADVVTNAPPVAAPTNIPPLGFQVGEELVYRVYWGFIPVAESRITTEWVQEDGRTLLAIRMRTVSNRVIEKIYPVDDFIESVVDPATFLPLRFTKKLSEGRYRAHQITTFAHTNLTAHWESKIHPSQKDFAIEPDTRDIVSFMYSMRSQRFRPGDDKHYRVMADEKIYDLWVHARVDEKVDLPNFGEISSVKIEPEAAFQGFFVREGKGWLWVSNDGRRLCTKMVATIPVANIKVLLWEVNGPGDDFWTRKTKANAAP